MLNQECHGDVLVAEHVEKFHRVDVGNPTIVDEALGVATFPQRGAGFEQTTEAIILLVFLDAVWVPISWNKVRVGFVLNRIGSGEFER